MEEAEIFFIQGLESKNENLQRCSLVCLIHIMNSGNYCIDKYLNILKTVAPNISGKNEDRLFFCLQKALNRNSELFQPIIESEIERRGARAAFSYIISLQGHTKHHESHCKLNLVVCFDKIEKFDVLKTHIIE